MLSTSRCEIPDVYASALCMRCFVETKTKRNVKLKRENSKECQIECRIPSQVEGQNICQIDCQIESQNIRQIECQNIFKICPNICPDISWHVMVGITRRKVFFLCSATLASQQKHSKFVRNFDQTSNEDCSKFVRSLFEVCSKFTPNFEEVCSKFVRSLFEVCTKHCKYQLKEHQKFEG